MVTNKNVNDSDREEFERLKQRLTSTYSRNRAWFICKVLIRKWLTQSWRGSYHFVKRLIDFVVSFVLLAILFLPGLALFFLIRRDGGPAFYSQDRIGLHGKPFRFWKFRSMIPNADRLKQELINQNEMKGGVLFKMKSDPRITPIGRFIRKFSIDELPQLWNVLRGDMSLVGPRPPLPDEVKLYTTEERHRLDSKQGITGLWQVSGRSDIPFEKQLLLDLDYIYNESIWNDIKLLIKTIPAVFTGRGAS